MLAGIASDKSQRRTPGLRRRLNPTVFATAAFIAAIVLVSIVAVPQWLSKHARWEELRSHVGQIGQLAASTVDGDLHRQLLDPANYSDELYARALKPLVRFHSANPDIFYVYTMVDRGGTPFFVLDTAASPDLRTNHQLRASGYMEKFELKKEYEDGWLQEIAAGKTYVTPNFEQDDYGYFLTAHVPIYDSKNRYSGFIGVDFDMQYYFAEEARFRAIAIGSLVAALIGALVVGYLVALYHSATHYRMQDLYDRSIRDDLTGLLNRRGAMDAINQSLRHAASHATLLVDIDNLKMINDLRGHVTGDAVIVRTAEAIRDSIRECDVCARLGGDEFVILAPDCDAEGAQRIARRILTRLSKQEMPLAGSRFSASIGIAVQDGAESDFTRMYSDADAALYHARAEGKSRFVLFAPYMREALQSPKSGNARTSGMALG